MDINFNELMKQAEEMQKRMQNIQKEIATFEIEGVSGAGLVVVTLTGRYECKKIDIDEQLLKESKAVVEEMIVSAFNAAAQNVTQATQKRMMSLTTDMKLPDDFKLPTGD